MSNPYQVTRQLEGMLCEYTGAKYAVCVNSCSAALLLSLLWQKRFSWDVASANIPRRTYVSVPMAIKLAGLNVGWRDEEWVGAYKLEPFPILDSARRFTGGMYRAGEFQCVSFSTTKILGIEQGGAVLCDDEEAYRWFKRVRFDGRTEGVDPADDVFDVLGLHCIMLPSIAAQLVLKLHHLPKHNADLPAYPYPDLSGHPIFK